MRMAHLQQEMVLSGHLICLKSKRWEKKAAASHGWLTSIADRHLGLEKSGDGTRHWTMRLKLSKTPSSEVGSWCLVPRLTKLTDVWGSPMSAGVSADGIGRGCSYFGWTSRRWTGGTCATAWAALALLTRASQPVLGIVCPPAAKCLAPGQHHAVHCRGRGIRQSSSAIRDYDNGSFYFTP